MYLCLELEHFILRSLAQSEFDAFTLRTPFRDNVDTLGLRWRLRLLHDRLRTGGDSPGF